MRRAYKPILFFVVLLAIIEAVIRLWGVPQYILPSPSAVAGELVSNGVMMLPHLGITVIEALLGYLIGNACAIVFGILFSQVQFLRQSVYPVVIGFQAVPVVAIAPFIIIWFGSGILGKAMMAALICYFPATVISTHGFMHVNRDALLLLQSIGASRRRIFFCLQLPSAIPAIVSALEVSATLCFVGAVVAELSGASRGVGYLIVRASYEFDSTRLFAVLVITSMATIVFFALVQYLGSHYARRYRFSYASAIDDG